VLFCADYGDPRDLHSFPTRRSSDLLGALPGDEQAATLRTALEDPAPDVRWNAAVALARHGSHEGVPVLRQMLDRAYVEQVVKRRSEEHTSELQSRSDLVCRLLLEKK